MKLLQPFSWSKHLKEAMENLSNIDKMEEKLMKCIIQKENDKKKRQILYYKKQKIK